MQLLHHCGEYGDEVAVVAADGGREIARSHYADLDRFIVRQTAFGCRTVRPQPRRPVCPKGRYARHELPRLRLPASCVAARTDNGRRAAETLLSHHIRASRVIGARQWCLRNRSTVTARDGAASNQSCLPNSVTTAGEETILSIQQDAERKHEHQSGKVSSRRHGRCEPTPLRNRHGSCFSCTKSGMSGSCGQDAARSKRPPYSRYPTFGGLDVHSDQ